MSKQPTKPARLQTAGEAIKQTQPFRSDRHEAMISLLLTVEAVRRPLQEMLSGHDELTHQQYNVLRILRGAADVGLPTLAIAERMIERTPGITRLLDRLEKKELVSRERSHEDRRQVFCRLSKKGRRLLAKLDRPVAKLDDQMLEAISDKEVKVLIRLLNQLRNTANQANTAN